MPAIETAAGAMAGPGDGPVVLASGSAVRTRLLASAGVSHAVEPADIDEATVRDNMLAADAGHAEIAATLAEIKAQTVSMRHPDAIVLGADQILSCEDKLFEKPANVEGVRAHLEALSGREHTLYTGVCAVRGGETLWNHDSVAVLRMRTLSDTFVDRYVGAVGEAACQSVGAYQMEGLGIHLFSEIDGDFFAILGLPLLPVLEFLRGNGAVLS